MLDFYIAICFKKRIVICSIHFNIVLTFTGTSDATSSILIHNILCLNFHFPQFLDIGIIVGVKGVLYNQPWGAIIK